MFHTGQLNSYSGGGYLVHFYNHSKLATPRLYSLQGEGWIDNRTKAVFVEFAVFNPNNNMFAICWLVIESTRAGAFMPRSRFDPIRLYRYASSFGIIVMITEGLFIIFLVIHMIQEFNRLKDIGWEKYLADFWSYINQAITVFSLGAFGAYVARYLAVQEVDAIIEETGGNVYKNIQMAALGEDVFNVMQSLILFFTFMKSIQLLKFNQRLSVLIESIHASQGELAGFTVMFAIVYTAFCMAFFLLLGSKLYGFSNYLLVNEEAFASMLGKFSFTDIIASSTLAPWFFLFFMLIQAMVIINMLVTIITNMFSEVKNDVNKQSSEYELISMLVTKFRKTAHMAESTAVTKSMPHKPKDYRQMDELDTRFDRLIRRLNKELHSALHLRHLDKESRRVFKRTKKRYQAEVDEERERIEIDPKYRAATMDD